MDNILMTLPQICLEFKLPEPTVRAWIARGRLQPAQRKPARGRGGVMLFYRGSVTALVQGVCPVCGDGFKRATARQVFCSQRCRQRANRAALERGTT
jgi:hypothetical protein